MPNQYAQFTSPARRLLWWLVAVLLLLGIASFAVSTLVASQIESWLRQRGLEAQIDYLQVSITDLRLVARGVRINNAHGRGLRARELMLDYSWWQLLRGEARLQRVYIEGAHMDLESSAGEGGRLWEIGGWALGRGQRRDRDFELRLDGARILDSRLCYRHRPDWSEADCVRFGDLNTRNFLLGMRRRGDEPLQLTIGADRLRLDNLLAGKKGAAEADTTLVELDISNARFARPGNSITADTVEARQFAGCPPGRWAEALPALGRLVGHCGAARRLQLTGELLFSFGKNAEVRWRRASGQGVLLRYSDSRHHNWRAETLALADFHYVRPQKKLRWESAGASAFDWCPKGLRNGRHHYCVRAGTLQLPDPVSFDWSKKLVINAGPGRLQQTQLLDLAGTSRNPLTAHLALLGPLQYRGATRRLRFDGLELESASGCIPGQLWGEPDYCLRLAGLHAGAPLEVRFASRGKKVPWGFAGGPLKLSQFSATRGGRHQLQLRGLRWQELNLMGVDAPLLAQDFGLQSLSGCLPDRLLPHRIQPLCAELENLDGRGNFAWSGAEGYLIAGELRLDRLLLADRLNGGKGLLLQKLHTGEGYFRRDTTGSRPWIDDAAPPPDADIGAEKGLLPEELARRRQEESAPEPQPRAGPNLHLASASLNRLRGCLPRSWARLLYEEPQQMPTCFELLNLSQRGGLDLSWQGGVELIAGELTLEKAEAKTFSGERLLGLSGLQLPSARILHPGSDGGAEFSLPQFSLDEFHGCLPAPRPGLPRCLSTEKLRATGDSGLAAGETLLREAPGAEPLWRVESAEVERIAPGRDSLELTGLRLRELLACGLLARLPEAARGRGIADCVSARELYFAGNNRLVLKPALSLELGELRSQPIALWQEEGDYAPVGLQRLSWKKLRWDGGPVLWTTDLRLGGFRACLTGETTCVDLGALSLPGRQRLSLAAPYATDGAIELADLSFSSESREPWKIARLQLHNFSYGGAGEGLSGALSGAAGCLPAGALGDTRLAPCYRFGRVRLRDVEFIDTAAGRVTLLRGLSIEGLVAEQPDYPGGLPAPLLQLENLSAGELRLGGGKVAARELRLLGVAGCVPGGYVDRLDHCLTLAQIDLSGSYSAGDRSLLLSRLQMRAIDLDGAGGRELLSLESAAFEQLLLAPEVWGFQWFEAGKLALFKRREDAPEYHRHSWTGRWAGMEVEQLRFDRARRQLEIAKVDALRPRFLLLRDRQGQYPILGEITALTGARSGRARPGRARPEVKARFRYHIPDLNVRHGTFSWVDRRGEYRARLPIRAIYLTMRNISNHQHHPPAELLFNGRPGGFGEIQLAGTIDYLETRKWNADLTGYITDTSLIPAAPYMAELLGYKILQGQLNALLDIRVRENQVKALADMELEKIKVRRVRDDDELPVKSSFIPLGIALNLLKDGQGNVRFDMPVSGDLYDPKFSFSFIFSHLLQQAILESLFAYFTPVGLYTLAKFAWERFRAARFDPIVFQPGSDKLSPEALEQLNEILATLREHPHVRPGICGIANPRDWNAVYPQSTPGLGGSRSAREAFYRHPPLPLREEFERLAQERSRRVERFLIDAGITPAELIPCAADYNGRDFDQPRVEFSN